LRLALAVLLASVCVSLFFVVRLQPTSAGAFAFLAVWLAVPHGAMAALLIALQRRGKPLLPWFVAAVLVAIVGFVIGVVAKLLMPGPDPGGWFVTILVGIAGSWVGGFLFGLGGLGGGLLGFVGAALGAMLLLGIYRIVKGTKSVGELRGSGCRQRCQSGRFSARAARSSALRSHSLWICLLR
jgi:uncharacterized membrane protein YeaQ/YmgE (transglycosylase-associated protein family)